MKRNLLRVTGILFYFIFLCFLPLLLTFNKFLLVTDASFRSFNLTQKVAEVRTFPKQPGDALDEIFADKQATWLQLRHNPDEISAKAASFAPHR